ncbi:tetratricopeptide repeat domain 23, isoform CRA_a [Rattus norvegicus]|uniref:Tetratricopeptide repeat domain 23, isoform CRA_a n=1 Tax=Rattus norvegicus TaxID=10116 RepID=A6JBT3_RAT|nr:tetratricopeptide repeat domain 23, isoform CRA_a [Rattus norvegicus]
MHMRICKSLRRLTCPATWMKSLLLSASLLKTGSQISCFRQHCSSPLERNSTCVKRERSPTPASERFKEAWENLIKAERLSKEMLQCGNIIKEEWIEIQSRIKLSFAQLYQGQKRSKEAFPYYQKALEYTETTKDEKSFECAQVLREMAGVEQALALHDASIGHFSQAHLIILSKEPSPEDAADSALSIARAAVASGMHDHHDVAEKYFQESMTYLKDSEGTEKAKFLSIQDEFCSFLQTIGQKERAAMILRESLEAKIGVFGDFSPEVAETYRILGRADLAQGNNNGAHMKLKKGHINTWSLMIITRPSYSPILSSCPWPRHNSRPSGAAIESHGVSWNH